MRDKGWYDMNKRILCVILAGLLMAGSCINGFAASISSVQQQKTETQKKLNEMNKSITAIENKRKEVQSQISALNEDLVETMLTLEVIKADLERKEQEIDAAQAEFERYQQLEAEQYAAMKLRIQYMYEQGGDDYVSMLFGAKSLSELVNRADFAKEVSDYDEEKRAEYEETKVMVAETKRILEEEQAELEEVKEAQEAYETELNRKIANAKSKVKNFETELANAQAKAKEYQQTIQKQTAMIAKLQEEEKKRKEEERKKAEAAANAGGNGQSSGGSSQSSGGGSQSSGGSVQSSGGSGLGASIANYALKFVGNPYVYGGTSLTNGADCSGFTWAVHQHFGISIPRRSTDQSYGGKRVSLSDLQAGDIIYYGDHVGIYIGGGQIVHASTKSTGIKISHYAYRTPLRASRYW